MMGMEAHLEAVDEVVYCKSEAEYASMPSAAEWYPKAKKTFGDVDASKFAPFSFGFAK